MPRHAGFVLSEQGVVAENIAAWLFPMQ